MAERKSGSSRSKAKAASKPAATPPGAPEVERKDTVYVVLLRVRLANTREVMIAEGHSESVAVVRGGLEQGVWVPVMEHVPDNAGDDGVAYRLRKITATDADAAVEVVTGKGEGALVGDWKAVALLNWKGVVTVDPPEQVMQDRRKVSTEE
jgi:hypothetical protein